MAGKDSSSSMKVWKELESLKNTRDFFDDFERIEQKCRIKDNYPTAKNLIGLDNLDDIYKEVYGSGSKSYKIISQLIESVKKKKMEYSISIDGAGRTEFIKMQFKPEQEEEKEEEKNLLEQIADKLG